MLILMFRKEDSCSHSIRLDRSKKLDCRKFVN